VEDGHGPGVLAAEPLGEELGDHDAPVIAAGAADCDREPRLALLDVRRDREVEELLEEVEEAAGHRLAQDVVADLLGHAGERPQLRHVIGVGDEPDVEDQVRLERHSELVAEADQLHGELVGSGRGRQLGEEPLPQLAEREVRGIDDHVGLVADRFEEAALLGDRVRDAAMVAEGMAMAGLAEAPDQDVVAGLEEDDPRLDPAPLESAAHRPKGDLRIPAADVEHDRHAGEPRLIRRDQLGQIREELAWQVVDDEVAEILEELRGGGLATPGEAREDHDRLLRDTPGHGLTGRLRHRPVRLMNCTVSSKSTYMVPPRANGLTRSPPGVATAAKIAIPRIT
jgi:hypothetical protein